MSELKPCPFCGSTNVELRKGMFWNGAVHCNDCSADVVFDAVELIAKGDYDWQTAVTDGWNRRAREADAPDAVTPTDTPTDTPTVPAERSET